MTRRPGHFVTCLLVLAAFALAPLAQAVDCVMHVPVVAEEAIPSHHNTQHESHGGDHNKGQRMVVADCFAAAMDAVAGGDPGIKLPVAGLVPVVEPVWVARAPVPYTALAMRPWRGPPPDVLQISQRRRI